MTALADQILQCGFLTVQRVGDGSLNGQGAVGVTFIIHIGIVGVPHQLFAVLCELGAALGVLILVRVLWSVTLDRPEAL